MKQEFPVLIGNPMLFEIRRSLRRFSLAQYPLAARGAALALIGILYLWLINLCASFPDPMEKSLYWISLVGVTLIAPLSIYATIAGERDKRSWELLCAAPLSNGQIVVGKFLAGAVNVAIPWLLLMIPAVICASTPRPTFSGYSLEAPPYDIVSAAQNSISLSFMILGWGLLWTAIGTLISARSRRALTALAAVLGLLAMVNIVFPALLAPLNTEAGMHQAATCWLPSEILWANSAGDYTLHRIVQLPPMIAFFVYLAAAAAMLFWAVKTVGYADRNLKTLSIPKSHAQR